MITQDLYERAKRIALAHQNLYITPTESFDASNLSSINPVYIIAKLAAFELGFIEIDAECIANAWSKMTPDLNHWSEYDWPDELHYFSDEMPLPPSPSCPQKLGLYVVAPSASWIKRLVNANVETVQLRFKSENREEIEAEIVNAIEAVGQSNSKLFINDYWDLAIKHGAYGIHLGQEDLQEANVQRIKESGLRLGISTHGYAEMLIAHRFNPSYIALGAIFPTTLKRMKTAPQGLGRLYHYAKLMKDYPLVGIGGIDLQTVDQVLQSGIGSIAVVRAIINSDKPLDAIKAFKAHF